MSDLLRQPSNSLGAGSASGDAMSDETRSVLSSLLESAHLCDGSSLNGFDLEEMDSLVLMGWLASVEDRLGVRLSFEDVLNVPDFDALVALVVRLRSVRPDPVTQALPKPLSIGQEALWSLQSAHPDDAGHNVYELTLLDGSISARQLRAAWDWVVCQHPQLCLTVSSHEGAPVTEDSRPVLEEFDLGVCAADFEEALRDFAAVQVNTPFEMSGEPLVRLLWVRSTQQKQALLLVAHHLVMDARSLGLVCRELSDAYVLGDRAPVPPETRPTDHRAWAQSQRQYLASEEGQEALDWWLARLRQAEPLELPTRGVKPVQSPALARRSTTQLSARLVHRLRERGQSLGASLNMVMLAAFGHLMRAVTGQSDFVIGVPESGRDTVSVRDSVGYFVNVLPVVPQLGSSVDVDELIARTRDELFAAFDRRRVPFAEIVRALNPRRSTDDVPLLQVLFAMQNTRDSADVISLPDVATRRLELDGLHAQFQLVMFVEDIDTAPRLVLEYRADLFESEQVDHWLAGYVDELKRFAEPEPTALPAVADDVWSVAASNGVFGQFASQAERYPAKAALIQNGQTMSYQRLLRRSRAVAGYLVEQGLRPGEVVAVRAHRGFDAVTAMLGVLGAGGTYLPLDPDLPRRRADGMLDRADVRFLLCGGGAPTSWGRPALNVVEVVRAGLASEASLPPVAPSDGCYINFTSGSTGVPKGVLVEQRSVLNLVRARELVDFGPHQVFLHAAPLQFDASTFEVWGALLHGSTCVIVPEHRLNLREVGDAIRLHGVTVAWLTASLFRLFVETQPQSLAPLKHLLTGGEVVSPTHAALVKNQFPNLRLVNGYGPTETTTFATCFEVKADADAGPLPIGRPLDGVTVRVLDEHLEEVPAGTEGEICIGGAGVARGYVGDAPLTAEKFVRWPGPSGDERLYRTGDRGRWRPDGNLEFLGRDDRQIKRRGHRIELDEVEAHIARCAGVRQVAVVEAGGQLIAFVAVDAGTEQNVTRALDDALPGYMQPDRWRFQQALALTASGKVDRARLKWSSETPSGLASENAPPAASADEASLVIRDAFALVLEQPVELESDYFDLGGSSLDALRLLAEIEQRLGVSLSLRDLIDCPTPKSLAARIGENPESAGALVPLNGRNEGEAEPLFVVHAAGGNVVGFVEFARHLPAELPLLGIQANPRVLNDDSPADLREIAAGYVAELLRFRPQGPFHLAGVSVGGVIAFEMAAQLQQLGHRVGALIIGDTWLPEARLVSSWRRLAARLSFWLHIKPSQLGALWRARRNDRARSLVADERTHRFTEQHTAAYERYVPSRFEGDVVLVSSTVADRRRLLARAAYGNDAMGWDHLVSGDVRVIQLPGDHNDICYGRNASRFAEILRDARNRAARC